MTDPEDKKPAKQDVEQVLAEFDGKEDILAAFCIKTRDLIEAILQDAGVKYQSVQFRVKRKEKLREKYLDPSKDYRQLSHVTDLAGLRIITYYEDDVDRAARVINDQFDIDPKNSIDKRNVDPDRFGYTAINYVGSHLGRRLSDVEYKRFAGIQCEIQITSILRHAWAEIEHEWYDLKDAYPKAVKRRFYRIAALLELAESEFLDIRRTRTAYERSVAVRVEAKVPDTATNAISIRPFLERDPLVTEIDSLIAEAVGRPMTDDLPDRIVESRAKAANAAGLNTIQAITEALTKYKPAILEFAKRCNDEFSTVKRTSQLNKGVCVYQASVLITSIRGRNAVDNLFGAGRPWDIDRMIALAAEVIAKYPSQSD